MSLYTWSYGAEGSALYFTITYDTEEKTFTVRSIAGSFDLNALWFASDAVTGSYTLIKSDNSLNMNGTTTVWDDSGVSSGEKITWDGYEKLSSTGLGSLGENKDTFISQGETDTFDATAEFIAFVASLGDGEGFTLGVRATSVNGDGSIKWADTAPVIEGNAPNYFTFLFDSDGPSILAAGENYTDNRSDPDFDGTNGEAGTSQGPTNLPDSGNNYNDNTLTAENGTPGGSGTSGMDAVDITNPAPYDGIKIISDGSGSNEIRGGDGGAGGTGGAGGSIVVDVNNNANGNTLTAGDGGNGGNGGDGGHAIVNGALSVVIIEGSQDLTILGGTGGAGGAGGAGGSISVDAGSNVKNDTLTAGDGGAGGDGSTGGTAGSGGDVTINAGGSTTGTTTHDGTNGTDGASTGVIAAFSDRVDVDATAFTAHLTISGSDYNDTMQFGSGGTTVYATEGSDTYTFGSGADTIVFTSVGQSDGSTATDTIVAWDSTDIDKIDVSALYSGVLAFAGNSGLAANSLGWYESGGNTHVVADIDGDASADLDVILEGAGLGLTSANFIL